MNISNILTLNQCNVDEIVKVSKLKFCFKNSSLICNGVISDSRLLSIFMKLFLNI